MRSGHDEESQNGRDVKIDILDDYIRTSERFRVIRVFSEYRVVTGKQWALMGFSGKRGKASKGWLHPLPFWSELDKGKGAATPFLSLSFPFPSSFLPLLVHTKERDGILLPVRVGLLLLSSFIYLGRGHPMDTQVDH